MTHETRIERLEAALIRAHISEAARLAGVEAHVVDDLKLYSQQFEVAPDFQTIRHRESHAAPADWLTSMRESRPHWFGSQSSGGAESFTKNPWESSSWNITAQGQVIERDYKLAERMAAAAGVDVMAAHPKKT
jgi:hypothetical protein